MIKVCRICLEYKRNLCSVFEGEQGISYAHMLKSLAQIKIAEDACKSNICLQCRRKLRSSYDFKKQIERSDLEINLQQKIIKFNNIHEIKLELIEEIKDNENKVINNADVIVNNIFQNNTLQYKNTTIKKLNSNNNILEKKINHLPVMDQIEMMYEDDSDHIYDDELYDDFTKCDKKSSNERRNIRKLKRKETKERGTKKKKIGLSESRNVCIKPVMLPNIKLIRSNPHNKKRTSEHKNKRNKRQDMCPHCGIMSKNLKSHILVHVGVKKFKCLECNKGFFTSQHLKYHQRRHLTVEIFKCDHCVATFRNKASLQSHMISHTNIKNYICAVCNKGFKRKYALLRHNLIHNSSAKSIKCELCNMSFLYKQGLAHHMRVHTGERPYKCEICSQPYSYKHDFNRHCLKKHGVFLKRRSVYVMNEEVLMQERELMKDLMLRVQGVVKEGETLNPFQGPQAALAFKQAVKDFGSSQIPLDVML